MLPRILGHEAAGEVVAIGADVQGIAETHGDGVDVLLEMSGNATALRQGLQALTQSGRVSLLGLFGAPVSLDLNTEVMLLPRDCVGGGGAA